MRLAAQLEPNQARAIHWDECPCPSCAAANFRPLLEAADPHGGQRFLIVECQRCGLAFTNPRPDPINIQQFYPADYRCHQSRVRETHRPLSRCVARTLQPFGQARLLDFGCGGGNFMRRMAALGWNVTGLDLSDAAAGHVRESGLHAYSGTLPHPRWDNACFEAITMWQSLEHVHQPLEVLRAAHRLLTDSGRLLVAVPNFAGLGAKWFGANWYGLDVPRHLTHFTPQTLSMMLKQAGFAPLDVRQERHNSWLRHSAARVGGGFLGTRLGSGVAGWWGYLTGQAEGLVALAAK